MNDIIVNYENKISFQALASSLSLDQVQIASGYGVVLVSFEWELAATLVRVDGRFINTDYFTTILETGDGQVNEYAGASVSGTPLHLS